MNDRSLPFDLEYPSRMKTFGPSLNTLETKLSAVAESRLQAAVTRLCKPPEGGTHNAQCLQI